MSLPEKPRLSTEKLLELLEPFNIDRKIYPLIVIGIRGYYRCQMGAPEVNDRGIYDDAIFIHSSQAMVAYNGNTDPSKYRQGEGNGAEKGMASLNPGVWYAHRFDYHKGDYLALCQREGKVSVTRDGDPPYIDTGNFGINIHRGGYNTTSSEGCQTIHPSQWDSFIKLAEDQAKRYYSSSWKSEIIPYVLLEPDAILIDV